MSASPSRALRTARLRAGALACTRSHLYKPLFPLPSLSRPAAADVPKRSRGVASMEARRAATARSLAVAVRSGDQGAAWLGFFWFLFQQTPCSGQRHDLCCFVRIQICILLFILLFFLELVA